MKYYVCSCCREALPASAYERWGTIGGFMQWVCGAKGTCDDCRDCITEFPAFKPVPITVVDRPARPGRIAVQGLNGGVEHPSLSGSGHEDLFDGDVVVVPSPQEPRRGRAGGSGRVANGAASGTSGHPGTPRAAAMAPASGDGTGRLARFLRSAIDALGAVEAELDRRAGHAGRNGSEPPVGTGGGLTGA